MISTQKDIWAKFFQHPLISFLEKHGYSIEGLTLYCLIHHDHHFFLTGFLEDINAGLDFDLIRDLVEFDFVDFHNFLRTKTTPGWRDIIVKLARFLEPAHEWSLKIAGL